MKAMPRLPGYQLLHCLGGGVITSVYSARTLEHDRPCAVKMLRADWEDQPIAVKLLQREARACLAVRHPHLVHILHEHVMTRPRFLVMEYLEGESLRRRLRREYRLDVPTALWIARQTAEALAALHRRGFIHSDIKPENIRLVDVGKAILLDLGFTHRAGENIPFLEKGYILGTVNYLAPELCGQEPKDGPLADVYSLGITLFEMLAGQLPFAPGTPLEVMHFHRTEDPKLLTDVIPDAPAALTELIDAMLSRDPADRPSVGKLLHTLVQCEIASLANRCALRAA